MSEVASSAREGRWSANVRARGGLGGGRAGARARDRRGDRVAAAKSRIRPRRARGSRAGAPREIWNKNKEDVARWHTSSAFPGSARGARRERRAGPGAPNPKSSRRRVRRERRGRSRASRGVARGVPRLGFRRRVEFRGCAHLLGSTANPAHRRPRRGARTAPASRPRRARRRRTSLPWFVASRACASEATCVARVSTSARATGRHPARA